ncbi:hypothetical protein CERZMDRAFT_98938 [Cercospora zeae-maydis SCOH1-5]|uniref:Uncharacterized protein n=1 Tax=Cercospora zeae-maydis SCOH1-5 TaxID=717836 RepID=A0A6A6FBK0_9PEZI|nr:hypothetical protein CERZMDRAFT_98938 [Cercospora zeae-maydis SCOH1-5]
MARSTFGKCSLSRDLDALTRALWSEGKLVNFLTVVHHDLAYANFPSSKEHTCGLTIAVEYFLGGLVPLLPYLFFERISEAKAQHDRREHRTVRVRSAEDVSTWRVQPPGVFRRCYSGGQMLDNVSAYAY